MPIYRTHFANGIPLHRDQSSLCDLSMVRAHMCIYRVVQKLEQLLEEHNFGNPQSLFLDDVTPAFYVNQLVIF